MTHDEARDLLPGYSLGALDDEAAALEAHLEGCPRCSAQLAAYLETTAALGGAVAQREPPAHLRAAVLADAPLRPLPRAVPRRRIGRPWLAAALLLLALGLAGGNLAQRRQLAATRSELALDSQGLALLTSTETTVQRLVPAGGLGGQAHGHWYHQPGIATQVLVIEFMPPPPAGESYYGWLQRSNGSWQAVGAFTLDAHGYGRRILLGSDGADVVAAEVTRQGRATPGPAGPPLLRWPAP